MRHLGKPTDGPAWDKALPTLALSRIWFKLTKNFIKNINKRLHSLVRIFV